ncbi:DNA-directed RNA polymerase I subunit RPA34.5-domain-containing protein [Aspergillus oleicola]
MAPKSVKESKPAREQRSESDSSSSAESNRNAEESSSSDSDSSASESDAKVSKNQNGQSDKKISQRAFRAPQPYKPPLGFKSASKTQQPSTTTSTTLSSLNGKQIFHITAPSFLPLSKIKEVSLAGTLKGEPILEHKGKQYGIPGDSLAHAQGDGNGQTLYIYDPKAQTYHSTVTKVPTYHIQEMIALPGGKEFDEASAKTAKALEKPPRKQPKNLKMRFRPVGSGDAPPETLGSSDEESEGEGAGIKMSQGVEKEKEKEEKKKRKHQQTEGDGSQARKKSKKHSLDNADGEEKSKKSKDRDGKKRKKSEKA